MTTCKFLFNLRPDTSSTEFSKNVKPKGFLLSAAKITPGFLKMALSVKEGKKQLLMDNGNFSSIQLIAKKHSAKATALSLKIKSIEDKKNRIVDRSDFPKSLATAYDDLAKAGMEDVKKLILPGERLLDLQLKANPTHIIGVENPTMALWLSLGIEPEFLKLNSQEYKKMNEKVASDARKRISLLPSDLKKNYFPVASAMSFDSAFDAGSAFGKEELWKASMGFGGFMADDSYVDKLTIGNKKIQLDSKIPSRYPRSLLAVRGYWDGFKKSQGVPPIAFHFLGLGAPIMMPLVALCAWGTKEITFDATSPIKDAVEGTLYLQEPTYLKVRTRSFAERLIKSTDNMKWDCKCPFCSKFQRLYPFNYKAGRDWFHKTKKEQLDASDLKSNSALGKALPLLSEPDGGQMRRDIDIARIGHNHWVTNKITLEIEAHSKSKADLKKFTQKLITNYFKSTNSEYYAKAVEVSFNLAVSSEKYR